MEESCFICDMCEAGKDESGFEICLHKGYVRYVAWGVYPVAAPKKRGRKPTIKDIDVAIKIMELPITADLEKVAKALGVSKRTVERAIEPLGARNKTWGTFRGLQAAIKNNRPRRLHSSRHKKGLRSR
jgi:hypothetical protein